MSERFNPVDELGALSQLPGAFATRGLDGLARTVNNVVGTIKGGVFGGVSIVTSDNPTATAIGVGVSMVVTFVGGGSPPAVIGGYVLGIAAEKAARHFGIGADNDDNDDNDPYGGLSNSMDSDDPDYDEDGNWIGDGRDPNENSQTSASPGNSGPSSQFTNLDQDGDGFYDGGGNDGGGDGPGSGGKPVVLDLDGDGVELVALEDSTAFYDIDGDGYRERMGWVAADDGLLAYDKNGCCIPRYFVADFSDCFVPVDARFVTLLRHRRRAGRGRFARGGGTTGRQ